MATNVIMPALEMAQETGKVLQWLKPEGASVSKGEPIMEIETDKVTVEIEAPASGILAGIRARTGDTVPVGQTIAWILAAGEPIPSETSPVQSGRTGPAGTPKTNADQAGRPSGVASRPNAGTPFVVASPVAVQIAKEHGIDLALVKPSGGRVEKSDVLAYLQTYPPTPLSLEGQRSPKRSGGEKVVDPRSETEGRAGGIGRIPASPKARRLAAERGLDLATVAGSGPEGAILSADTLELAPLSIEARAKSDEIGTVWRIMAERMTASWTTVPHFNLIREVDAGALVQAREQVSATAEQDGRIKPTYTDLLVKIVASALSEHPRVNASWVEGSIQFNPAIHVGLATAIQEGLIVPVIHHANRLSLAAIAAMRHDLVQRANAGRLRPADISGGTFTLTNLGMYNVDAFQAIVNPPQAAILAVGRIADRVVALNGQPTVRPVVTLALSCDHRVVDGARAAQFLDHLAQMIEQPRPTLT